MNRTLTSPPRPTVYADWCGPCKMIAPTFESLATKYSKPGRITFCKVNTDNQQAVAQAHGVRAMPTFIIFKSGSAIETIQGANPPALTAAVEKAVKLAGTAAPGAAFKTPGRTLGGSDGAKPARGAGSAAAFRRPSSFTPFNILNVLMTFFGLYFVSLLSVSAITSRGVARAVACWQLMVTNAGAVRPLQVGGELGLQRPQAAGPDIRKGPGGQAGQSAGRQRWSSAPLERREDAGRP